MENKSSISTKIDHTYSESPITQDAWTQGPGVTDQWESDWSWYIPVPICGTLGIVGNVLITIVMLRDRFKGQAMKIHLLSLAFSDTIVIISYFYFFLSTFMDIAKYEVVCKSVMALRHVFVPMGSWTVVFISIERCYIVSAPHKALLLNGFRIALTSEILLFLFSLAMGIPTTILTGKNSVAFCNSYGDNLSVDAAFVLQFIRCLLYYVFPFIIILVCSSISIVKLRKNAAFWERAATNRDNKDTLFATRMLMFIGIVFAVTTIPYGMFKLYKVLSSVSMNYTMDRVLPAVLNLNLVNHCINFYQYCLTGAFFREELREVCCRSNQEELEEVVQQQRF